MLHVNLYKNDSTGKARFWQVERDGAKYRTIAGVVDGKAVTSEWTTCTPKNEGRSNETSAEKQAELEVLAMYDKKRKTGGYSDNIESSGKKYIEPMLAKKWEDEKLIVGHQIMFSQPKLDGFRCVATKDGLFSRKGDQYFSVPHIEKALYVIFAENPDLVLDGELYNHDLKDNFNEIASLVRKKKPTPAELIESEKMVQYHVYDHVDTSKPFSERIMKVNQLVAALPGVVEVVRTTSFDTVDHLDALYAEYLEQGYEGQMIRLDTRYENKRSKTLMKRKEFQDDEFPIVSIEEGLGNRSGMAGRVTCALPDGRTFGAGIKGGVKVNGDLWTFKDALIGKKATIRFFNYTPDGIPRFPVYVDVRDDV